MNKEFLRLSIKMGLGLLLLFAVLAGIDFVLGKEQEQLNEVVSTETVFISSLDYFDEGEDAESFYVGFERSVPGKHSAFYVVCKALDNGEEESLSLPFSKTVIDKCLAGGVQPYVETGWNSLGDIVSIKAVLPLNAKIVNLSPIS